MHGITLAVFLTLSNAVVLKEQDQTQDGGPAQDCDDNGATYKSISYNFNSSGIQVGNFIGFMHGDCDGDVSLKFVAKLVMLTHQIFLGFLLNPSMGR